MKRATNESPGYAAAVKVAEPKTYEIPFPAMGKPTMTRSDKWKQRDCVMRYRKWCDTLAALCAKVPAAAEVEHVWILAEYRPPESLSFSKRIRLIGHKKRTKPDGDNIVKAISDALWSDDHKLGGITVERYWSERDMTTITIYLGPSNVVADLSVVLAPASAGKDER